MTETSIYMPGQWRCAKCGFGLTKIALNMGDGTVTADMSGSEKCPNDGSPLWRVSWREAYEQLYADYEKIAPIMRLIDELRADEGASVTIVCDNPEGSGPDNNAVGVCDQWTDYEDRPFYGHTLEAALREARSHAYFAKTGQCYGHVGKDDDPKHCRYCGATPDSERPE